MASKLYVGRLSVNTTDDTLRAAFSEAGEVLDAIVVKDCNTGRPCGFGFITFSDKEGADAAIKKFSFQELDVCVVQANHASVNSGGGGYSNQ